MAGSMLSRASGSTHRHFAHTTAEYSYVGWFSVPYGGGQGTKHMLPAVHSIYFATSSLSRTGKITEAKGKGSWKGIGVRWNFEKWNESWLVGQPRVVEVEIDSDTLRGGRRCNRIEVVFWLWRRILFGILVYVGFVFMEIG